MAGAVVLAEGERTRIVRWLTQEADNEDLLARQFAGTLKTASVRQLVADQMRQYSAACRLIARRLEDVDGPKRSPSPFGKDASYKATNVTGA